MGFGQWCSPRCCTGYKYNVILPWVQEACLIDKCEGKKKCDSTEYQCVSKYVSAPESHKAKAMLDGIWLWLILLMLKEGEDVEGATESVMSVSGLHREHQTNHQNICAEGKKKNQLNFWKSPLCFPLCYLLACSWENCFHFEQHSLSLVFIFCSPAALPVCNKSVLLWAFASLPSTSSELWEEHAGKWELS